MRLAALDRFAWRHARRSAARVRQGEEGDVPGRAVSCERLGDRDGSEEIAPHCLEAEVVADEGAGTHGPTRGPGREETPLGPATVGNDVLRCYL